MGGAGAAEDKRFCPGEDIGRCWEMVLVVIIREREGKLQAPRGWRPGRWPPNDVLDSQISPPQKELELSGPKCQSCFGKTLV